MANLDASRIAFKSFLGDELYNTFIEKGYDRHGELRYWQQKEWERFIAVHPEFAISPGDLALAFRVCHLHGIELLRDSSMTYSDDFPNLSDEYVKARNQHFPHAAVDCVEGRPPDCDLEGMEVWYCPSCREAFAKWEELRSAR